jgi:hypothetical protein
LRHIINPITKHGVEEEEETSQPECPVLAASHEKDTDCNSGDTECVHKPSVLHCIAFEEGFSDCKMYDKYNLQKERPNYKQFVKPVQVIPSSHYMPPIPDLHVLSICLFRVFFLFFLLHSLLSDKQPVSEILLEILRCDPALAYSLDEFPVRLAPT